jgi:hypothetical protein
MEAELTVEYLARSARRAAKRDVKGYQYSQNRDATRTPLLNPLSEWRIDQISSRDVYRKDQPVFSFIGRIPSRLQLVKETIPVLVRRLEELAVDAVFPSDPDPSAASPWDRQRGRSKRRESQGWSPHLPGTSRRR